MMARGTYEVEGALKTAFGLLTDADVKQVITKAKELQAKRQEKYND